MESTVTSTTITDTTISTTVNNYVNNNNTNKQMENSITKIRCTNNVKSEQENGTEDVIKYNSAPRLTHPPHSFPTYQGTYCSSPYRGGMESRGINGVSYPLSVENIKNSYGRGLVVPTGSELEWRT